MYSAQCGDTVALILKVVVFSNGGRYIGFSHISVGIVAQASVLAVAAVAVAIQGPGQLASLIPPPEVPPGGPHR